MIRGVTVHSSAEPTLWSAPRAAAWSRRLLLLAVAFGLVLMHHIVGAHQHSPGPPPPGPASTYAVMGHAAGTTTASSPTADTTERTTGHVQGQAVAATQDAPVMAAHTAAAAASVSATISGGASLHVHPDPAPGPDMATLFHECLALLAAAAALALWFASRRAPPECRRRTRPARVPGAARPPPTPVPLRLAQLQILRL